MFKNYTYKISLLFPSNSLFYKNDIKVFFKGEPYFRDYRTYKYNHFRAIHIYSNKDIMIGKAGLI